MHPVLFAEIDWSQAFMGGLIGGGAVLVLMALVYFFRAMTANREESKSFEEAQPIYLGALGLGIVLVIAGLFFRGSLGGGSGDSSSMSNFTEFVSKDGKFKASFPGTPKERTQSALGMKFKMFLVEEKDGVFGVAYFDLPAGIDSKGNQVDSILTNARRGMLQNMNGTLIKEDHITLQGKYPGREIRADVPSKGAEMYCSIYLVNNRAYQVLILGKTEWLNSDKARKFLNSFALR
ncbi:MAG TPA: hypothetical protein PLN21_03410 [Gemmatales bacterium]|nr:hypothetical protein [Gemmatales bacterium]